MKSGWEFLARTPKKQITDSYKIEEFRELPKVSDIITNCYLSRPIDIRTIDSWKAFFRKKNDPFVEVTRAGQKHLWKRLVVEE